MYTFFLIKLLLLCKNKLNTILYRACYVLLGCKELQNAENFLLGLAFPRNHDDTSKPIGVRLRALQVLTAITNTQYLEEITTRDKESIG